MVDNRLVFAGCDCTILIDLVEVGVWIGEFQRSILRFIGVRKQEQDIDYCQAEGDGHSNLKAGINDGRPGFVTRSDRALIWWNRIEVVTV